MGSERILVEYLCNAEFRDLPATTVSVIRNQLLAVIAPLYLFYPAGQHDLRL